MSLGRPTGSGRARLLSRSAKVLTAVTGLATLGGWPARGKPQGRGIARVLKNERLCTAVYIYPKPVRVWPGSHDTAQGKVKLS